ncbi:MAG: phospholipase [Acidobacteriota bacterium]|jgi:phospholipase C|nr:phospholipase [Acidobacteriota bacterium]
MPSGNNLSGIEHIVVLMLENRSFDHMLGFLYTDAGNKSPSGQPFEGLTGKETNPDSNGKPVTVFQIKATDKNAYFMPGADPGEGYAATNSELFQSTTAPNPPVATNQGFVTDFAYTLGWQSKGKGWSILPGTVAQNIMGCFTPAMLPVLSGLARGYAVCDQWYSSAPTETMPNRAFANAATSQGHMNDATKSFTVPSIFGLMSQHNVSWIIYGYDSPPMTRLNFPDTTAADKSHFGLFKDFQAAAAAGTLPSYSFVEPEWGTTGNSQHPNYDVALGEQLIHDVYYALLNGKAWNQTLLVVTYDEHGGLYDHVAPPQGATPPDSASGEYGFDFKRFGLRVPAVLISPLIKAGTVFRVPAGTTPLDHTSILKTAEKRWNLPALTARDGAAPDFGDVLTLSTPRTDDPLKGVVVPKSSGMGPAPSQPSHLQQVHAELASQLPVKDEEGNAHPSETHALRTGADYKAYIRARTAAWDAHRSASGGGKSTKTGGGKKSSGKKSSTKKSGARPASAKKKSKSKKR